MHTITSKQLYDLIISEKLNVKLVTSRHFNAVGMADIIEKEDFMTDLEKAHMLDVSILLSGNVM